MKKFHSKFPSKNPTIILTILSLLLDAKIKWTAMSVTVSQGGWDKNAGLKPTIVPVVHVNEENVWKRKEVSSVSALQITLANLVRQVYTIEWIHVSEIPNGPYACFRPIPRNSVTILDVSYVVYIIITSVHQRFWINGINSFWVTASWKIKVLTTALFSSAFRNCTQNYTNIHRSKYTKFS